MVNKHDDFGETNVYFCYQMQPILINSLEKNIFLTELNKFASGIKKQSDKISIRSFNQVTPLKVWSNI